MKLLYYNELKTSKVKRSFEKIKKHLEVGDFAAAQVKKMPNTGGYYRAKLDKENRLLFRFATYQGESYLLLLEIIHHHAYDKSKFLNGAAIDEAKLKDIKTTEQIAEEAQPLVYVNNKRSTFHLLDKVICFDSDQDDIYHLPTPLVIIGSAGSGKTALTLEKMKQFTGQVAYISLSSYLVENAQLIYYANGYDNEKQEIDFLSFQEFVESIRIPKGKEITFKRFEAWYNRYKQTFKFKEPYKIFEEFKGVLTGSVTDKIYLSRADYLKLGVKQSIFLAEEREKIYDLFEKYLMFLKEENLYDSNMVAYQYLELCEPKYDFVVVDEVQDITNVQLMLLLKSLLTPINFILSGDSNQIVHPNFFSWSKVKSLFFTSDLKGSAMRILKTNYRNSQNITELSNNLLKIKNARFGSIDKESTYLINTVSSIKGEINFFLNNDKIKKELNQKTQGSAKFAVLVMNNDEKARVRKFFKTPLVFSIQEAKGLEYENIILVNFISTYEKEFRQITTGITSEDLLDENLIYSRSKDKKNKELEAYKFYINSLYVAFTRAVKNLYIIEVHKKHDLLNLLGVVEPVSKLKLKTQESNEEEWLEEARRLELQGKLEQAQQIRDRLKGVQYISPEQAAQLVEEIFSAEKPNLESCKQLFGYAKSRFKTPLINRLYQEVGYGPAKQYMGEYEKAQKTFSQDCKNGSLKNIKRTCNKFGINFRDQEFGRTGLMIAALHDKQQLLDYFISQEADIRLIDNSGKTALQMVLLGYDLEYFKLPRLKPLYERFLTPHIKCISHQRLHKISVKSMEYFLVNYVMAIRDEVISLDDPPALQGLRMDDFMDSIEWMPDSILPPYRRKRQYVNSILSKNEIDRNEKYNRQLFKRKSRGCYNLFEGLEIVYE